MTKPINKNIYIIPKMMFYDYLPHQQDHFGILITLTITLDMSMEYSKILKPKHQAANMK